MSFIEICLDQLRSSINQSSFGKNIEMQYYLNKTSNPSRNLRDNLKEKPNTDLDCENLQTNPVQLDADIPATVYLKRQ